MEIITTTSASFNFSTVHRAVEAHHVVMLTTRGLPRYVTLDAKTFSEVRDVVRAYLLTNDGKLDETSAEMVQNLLAKLN